MLKVYDYDDEPQQPPHAIALRHLASELMDELGYIDAADMVAALHRTFSVCVAQHVAIDDHFREVYTYDGHAMHIDWLLSDLGCYLLLMNGQPSNTKVAQAQLHFIRAAAGRGK
jgi:DNA-damage-inducible protein D